MFIFLFIFILFITLSILGFVDNSNLFEELIEEEKNQKNN
tara:strand:- start:22 stop:141 length:120 start_codon:yes stop_codon:yes gene_type:complete